MNEPFNGISIIVPVAPHDESWRFLAQDLRQIKIGKEILFAGPKPPPFKGEIPFSNEKEFRRVAWIRTKPGRAPQMNQAARHAQGTHLWFLHADSRVSSRCAHHLAVAVEAAPEQLHFFDLMFHDSKSPLMKINELGVKIRSHLLHMPFGDQGFCIKRDLFFQLNGFDENAAYGEDHLFVWKCLRHQVRLHGVDAAISTSARKYSSHGWLKTTLRHQYLTYKQAIPEFIKTYGKFGS